MNEKNTEAGGPFGKANGSLARQLIDKAWMIEHSVLDLQSVIGRGAMGACPCLPFFAATLAATLDIIV